MEDTTARTDRLGVRSPAAWETLGFSYHDELLNIALFKTQPGFERNTIQEIDNRLEEYRDNLRKAEKARKRANEDTAPSAAEDSAACSDCEAKESTCSLLSTPVHATLLGKFHLASIFTSVGFGLCNSLTDLPRVVSQQYVVGAVPRPLAKLELPFLQQDPAGFLSPFDHCEVLRNTKKSEVTKRPVLLVAQIQLSPPISTVSAGNLVVPTLHLVSRKIGEALKSIEEHGQGPGDKNLGERDVTAMLVESFGWSDFVLLLRGRNLRHLVQCIADVTATSIGEVFHLWRELAPLDDEEEDDDGEYLIEEPRWKEEESGQLNAFKRRFERLVGTLSGEEDKYKVEFAKNRVFSMSSSIPGVLWPFANDALRYQWGLLDGDGEDLDNLKAGFDRWKVQGNAYAQVHLTLKPGHETRLWKKDLDEILKRSASPTSDEPGKRETYIALGHTDVIVPGSKLSRAETNDGQSKVAELMGRTYYLQWRLLQMPRHGESLWREDAASATGRNGIIPLIDLSVDVQSELYGAEGAATFPDALKNLETFPISDSYEAVISGTFAGSEFDDRGRQYLEKFQEKGVNRQVVNTLRHVGSLWREKLRDLSDSNRMIELVDSWATWIRVLRSGLQREESTPVSINDLIRSFTIPFGQAVVQRFITGYHMSEATDITAEYKGGLSKVLTGIDGLMKGVLALVDEFNHVGALTLMGHKTSASIAIETTRDPGREKSDEPGEYTYAVAHLNPTHLVHPNRIHTVLHEILHVVLGSQEFRSTLRLVEGGGRTLEILDYPKDDTDNGLLRARLEEFFVEYLLGWLVFGGKEHLYSRSYLLQVAVHIESHGNDERSNNIFRLEQILRGFVVQWMLGLPSEDSVAGENPETAKTAFKEWWRTNHRYVLNDDKEADVFGDCMGTKVVEWWQSELLPMHRVVKAAIPLYFGLGNDAAVATEESGSKSTLLRKQFAEALSEARERMDDSDLEWTQPIHCVFSKGKGDDPARLLRVRRLESLVAYLVLIRSFYKRLDDDWLKEDADCLFHVPRTKGKVDFSLSQKSGRKWASVLFDHTSGSLFTTDCERHREYMNLRMCFLFSLWHHAEVTKNSEINHMVSHKEDALLMPPFDAVSNR